MFFDYTHTVTLSRLHTRSYPDLPVPVRAAQPSDQPDVERIAEQTGFTDPYYFSEIFKRKTGVTPTGWRKSEPPHIAI